MPSSSSVCGVVDVSFAFRYWDNCGRSQSPISSSRKLVCLASEFLPFDLRLGWEVGEGGVGEEEEEKPKKQAGKEGRESGRNFARVCGNGGRRQRRPAAAAEPSASVSSPESTSRLVGTNERTRQTPFQSHLRSLIRTRVPAPKLQFPPPASPSSRSSCPQF